MKFQTFTINSDCYVQAKHELECCLIAKNMNIGIHINAISDIIALPVEAEHE